MKQLSERQEKFIDFYCRTGNAMQSALSAGYTTSVAQKRSSELKNRFQNIIDQRLKELVREQVPEAMMTITYLAKNAQSETVRLQAAKDIADRGGLKPTEKIEQQVTNIEKTTDELRSELARLMGTDEIQTEVPTNLN